MLAGLFGAVKSAVVGFAHSMASQAETLLSGYKRLSEVIPEVGVSDFAEAFEQYEGLPRLREDIYAQPSDLLISGRLHKESVFVREGDYQYILARDYLDPEGEPTSAILTIRSDKRMSVDELLASTDLPACVEATEGIWSEEDWEVIEAWVGA